MTNKSFDALAAQSVNNIYQVGSEAELRETANNDLQRHDKIETVGDITLTSTLTITVDDFEIEQRRGAITIDVGSGDDGIVVDPGSDSVRKGVSIELDQFAVASGRHGVRYNSCVRNCTVRGATGGHSGDAGGYLFYAEDSWGLAVRDVNPQGGTGGGVFVDGGHKLTMENVLAKGLAGDGIYVQHCIAPTIISCDGETCDRGIVVDQCTGAEVIAPYTENNDSYGLVLDGDATTPNRPYEVSTQGGRHKDNNGGNAQVLVSGIRDSEIGRFHYTSTALELDGDSRRVTYAIKDSSDVTDNGSGNTRLGLDLSGNRYHIGNGLELGGPVEFASGQFIRDNFGGASGQFRMQSDHGTIHTDFRDRDANGIGELTEDMIFNFIDSNAYNDTNDSMTADPESGSESGYLNVQINGSTKQIPFYDP
jgi:hypothetical protein